MTLYGWVAGGWKQDKRAIAALLLAVGVIVAAYVLSNGYLTAGAIVGLWIGKLFERATIEREEET